MAKDSEESKTAPIYNPDGSIAGYTTPEKAAELEAAFAPAPYESELSLGGGGLNFGSGAMADAWPDTGQPQGNVQLADADGGYGWEAGDAMTMNADGTWNEATGAKAAGNKAFIMGKIADGTATPEQQGWYDKYSWRMAQEANTTEPPLPVDEPPPSPIPTATPTPTPTDDWPEYVPIDYTNVPPPTGDGSFREVTEEDPVPSDTSWDWDAFRQKAPGDRQWGGYDQDYQAFERYQPGMDSPWGMPNIEGGNEDFYQQQFVNLLRDEQGFQNREREAQANRQNALDNPFEAGPTDWSWANSGKGLKEVTPGTGLRGGGNTGEWDYNQSYDLGKGSTNREIIAGLGNVWTDSERGLWDDHSREQEAIGPGPAGNLWGDSQYIGSFGNPNDFMTAFNANQGPDGSSPKLQAMYQKLANNLWAQGGGDPNAPGSSTPVGYAAPI